MLSWERRHKEPKTQQVSGWERLSAPYFRLVPQQGSYIDLHSLVCDFYKSIWSKRGMSSVLSFPISSVSGGGGGGGGVGNCGFQLFLAAAWTCQTDICVVDDFTSDSAELSLFKRILGFLFPASTFYLPPFWDSGQMECMHFPFLTVDGHNHFLSL